MMARVMAIFFHKESIDINAAITVESSHVGREGSLLSLL